MTSDSLPLHPTEGRIWVPESSKKTKLATVAAVFRHLIIGFGLTALFGSIPLIVVLAIAMNSDSSDDSVAISSVWVAEEATELTGAADWKVDSIYHQDDETAVAFLATPTDSMLLNLKLVDDEWTVVSKPEMGAPIE